MIIITNNAATPESDNEFLRNLNAVLVTDIDAKPVKSGIYLISHADNLGYAKGINLGAEFSLRHFDINHFLISNNDIHFINDNVVEKLIERLESMPDVGMIGPKVLGLDGRNQSPEPYYKFWNSYIWMYWLTPFLSSEKKKKIFKLNYSTNAEEGEHYKIMGSFFIVKAIDFINCGMMDPNTFLYGEEVILSERLNAINRKVYFFPQVAILHEHGKTINRYIEMVSSKKLQFKSESYYYRKYRGVTSFSIFVGKLSRNLYILLKSHFKQL